MRLDRRIAVVALFVCGALPTLAPAQDAAAQSSAVLEIPFFDRMPMLYQLVEVNPQGTARFEAKAEAQFKLPIIEGYHVLIVRPENAPARLYRVQVTEVDTPTSAKLAISPEAMGSLHKGDSCLIFRPNGSTTAQLKALPGVIPFASKPEASPDLKAAQRTQSINNLKQMGLALHNYHAVNNAFPPAVIYGPDGKPWHSWRVLILPYLEHVDIYNQYNFNEPWDGPKNSKLLDRMPAVYRDPVHGDDKGHFTHYAALVGAWKAGNSEVHTAFPPSGIKQGAVRKDQPAAFNFSDPAAPSIRNVIDGTSNTIAVAPVSPERKIPWMKPEDITVNADFPGLGKPGGIAAPYPTGAPGAPHAAPVLFLDGSVRTILDTIKPTVLKALATRDAGEVIDFNSIPAAPAAPVAAPAQTLKIHLDGGKAHASFD